MIWLEKKYVGLMSFRLEGFTQKSEFLWNFRCPICNDSKQNKRKMRGYIYRKGDHLSFMCHNCSAGDRFSSFLKSLDYPLWRQYFLEDFKERKALGLLTPQEKEKMEEEKPKVSAPQIVSIDLPTIASLPPDHSAKAYIASRKIPRKYWDSIYYTLDYPAFVNKLLPEHDPLSGSEPRIVFPYYNEKKELIGLLGREVGGASKIKYITAKINPDAPKLFGMDRLNLFKRIYVLEGPVDTLYLENACATMDSAIWKAINILGDRTYTFISDNQPRNAEVRKVYEKIIEMGQPIFIWPEEYPYKDVGEAIEKGELPSEMQLLIDQRTFTGLRAKLEYESWKR